MIPTVLSFSRKKTFAILALMTFWVSSCNNKTEATESENSAKETKQAVEVYDFEMLEPLLYTETDKTYLINFWAMWCAPCVKELPYFQQFAKNHPEIEVLFISLDFPEDIDSKLIPFLEKMQITSKVILLDDPDSNSWIDKIDPNWSGAIPFTIVFNKTKRLFYEHSFESLEELETEINNNFN